MRTRKYWKCFNKLNNLINICEKIEYILYKDFNMNILSHYYAHKINIDIKLSTSTVYYFKYIIKSS